MSDSGDWGRSEFRKGLCLEGVEIFFSDKGRCLGFGSSKDLTMRLALHLFSPSSLVVCDTLRAPS